MYKMFGIFANKTFIVMENIFKNKSACANCVNWKSGCYSLYPFIEKTNKDFIENRRRKVCIMKGDFSFEDECCDKFEYNGLMEINLMKEWITSKFIFQDYCPAIIIASELFNIEPNEFDIKDCTIKHRDSNASITVYRGIFNGSKYIYEMFFDMPLKKELMSESQIKIIDKIKCEQIEILKNI